MNVRRMWLVVAAAALAIGLIGAPPAAAPARAALPDLTLVSNARYEVQPEDRRVRVTIDIVATNRLRDTATRRFYFDRAFLAVPPGSTSFSLTSETGSPSVRVSQERDGYQILALTFGQRVDAQESVKFQLRFDLPDVGGAPEREHRVGQTFASFAAWAYASESTPGSTVSVVFPRGFTVRIETGELPPPTTDADGRTVFASPKLDDPLTFLASFVAERPVELIEFSDTRVRAPIGEAEAEVTIRAWPDDPEWSDRVGELFRLGLPVLHDLVGLPWDRPEPLVVQETVSRTSGGYAGMFDPREGRIEVAYYAGAFVVLHEAAHAWFNGALLADRWANEAFASYYAQSAGGRLEQSIVMPDLNPDVEAAAFPLNAWAAGGGTVDEAETYGYAASLELARRIAARAGHDGLRGVWQAAAAREAAYQPPHVDDGGRERQPEETEGPPDWRGLLDLLEERTGEAFDDLWLEWVVRDEEAGLLADRRAARDDYETVLREAGRWELPRAIRAALRAWEFETATGLLDEARTTLGRRTQLEAAAAAAGLRLPSRLETVFESEAGFAAATAEADAEAVAIELIAGASAARTSEPGPIQQLGLLGETPDARLAAARESFSAGDLEHAAREAVTARAIWDGAEELGRNRLLVTIGIALLVLLVLAVLVSAVRGRRPRARALHSAPATAAGIDERGNEPT